MAAARAAMSKYLLRETNGDQRNRASDPGEGRVETYADGRLRPFPASAGIRPGIYAGLVSTAVLSAHALPARRLRRRAGNAWELRVGPMNPC